MAANHKTDYHTFVSTAQFGGGTGDDAVEFLDIREAALVSVAEAFARRALPWQAQLCPRAIQDMEVARVRVRVVRFSCSLVSCPTGQSLLRQAITQALQWVAGTTSSLQRG